MSVEEARMLNESRQGPLFLPIKTKTVTSKFINTPFHLEFNWEIEIEMLDFHRNSPYPSSIESLHDDVNDVSIQYLLTHINDNLVVTATGLLGPRKVVQGNIKVYCLVDGSKDLLLQSHPLIYNISALIEILVIPLENNAIPSSKLSENGSKLKMVLDYQGYIKHEAIFRKTEVHSEKSVSRNAESVPTESETLKKQEVRKKKSKKYKKRSS